MSEYMKQADKAVKIITEVHDAAKKLADGPNPNIIEDLPKIKQGE